MKSVPSTKIVDESRAGSPANEAGSAQSSLRDFLQLAAHLCKAPFTLVSAANSSQYWSYSSQRMSDSDAERARAFSTKVASSIDSLVVIPDISVDERCGSVSLQISDVPVRFYCGVALRGSDGHRMGTLSIFAPAGQELAGDQREALLTLGRLLANQLCVWQAAPPEVRPSAGVESTPTELDARRWQQVFEQAEFGLAYGDIKTNTLLSVNPAFARQRGYTVDELIGRPIAVVYTPEERRAMAARFPAIDQAGHLLYESMHLRKDGTTFPVLMQVTVIKDTEGRPISRVAYAQDITDRKRAEEALRMSQVRLQQALEASNTGLWEWNTITGEVAFSREWKRQLGYDETELPDRFEAWVSLLHPDDRDRAILYAQEYRDNPVGAFRDDFRLRHKDGSYRWIDSHASFVTEADGRRIRLLGSHTDITARKKTETVLSSEKRILELIESNTPLPVILTEVCRMIEEVASGVWCSVLLLDEEGTHLRHGAAPSLPESYIRAIDGVAIGPSCGSCGTAAFTGQQVVVDDIASHPFWEEFRHLALPHGLRSCWSTPILTAGGQVLGTFAIYGLTAGCVFDERPVVERASHLACLAIERKRIEQALRVTEFSIQHAVDAVFWVDTQARILDVNHAACTILGYSREELLSKTVHDIDPNFPPEAWPAHWEDLKARRSFSFETDHRKKDGTTIRTETTVNYLIHEGREFNCVFMRDITERKRGEAQLHLTQFALERAGDMVFWVEPSSRLLLVNAAACERLGYSKEELLTMAVADIDPNYRREDWARHWEDLRRVGRLRFETQHRSKAGEVYPVEVVANFLVFDGKEYNFATVRDMSVQKRAEELLRFSEERFRLVAEATNDILWDWDLVTEDHWWSPNAREKFGCDPNAERSVAAWIDRLHPDDRDRMKALVERTLVSDARTVSADYRFRLADGSYGYFYDRGQIIRDSSGRAVRMVGAMIDMTLTKRAYASLETAYQRLQGMSRELQTVETNERRRLSRELHDEVGQLLTGLKFDLEASRQALSDKSAAGARRAFERTVRALETTDELFARLRRIVRALRPSVLEELGLKDAVEALVTDIQARSDLVCSVSVAGEMVKDPAAAAIESALYRMTQELVTNVVRHAQAMTLSVHLDVGTGHWALTVQDDGIGFNPRAESISGMGIRGVRERAEILGGRVDVSSAPGAGTTVTVWIPVRPFEVSEETPQAL